MAGIIAAVIAGVKGHKTFAWIVGSLGVLELILVLAGSPYAVGPGVLFIAWAIGMRKVTNETQTEGQRSKAQMVAETQEEWLGFEDCTSAAMKIWELYAQVQDKELDRCDFEAQKNELLKRV